MVAAPDQALPPLPPTVLIARDEREYLGPLNGLAAGLATLDSRADVAYLSSCDVPFLRPAFVRRVVEDLGEADVCVPEAGGFKHPLAAAYRVCVLPKVRELIAANRLRPVFLMEVVRTHVLGPADLGEADLACLRNVNTPEDYAAALRDAGYAPAGPA